MKDPEQIKLWQDSEKFKETLESGKNKCAEVDIKNLPYFLEPPTKKPLLRLMISYL